MAAPLIKTNEKGIYKRGSRYVVVYRDATGKQRWESCRTLKLARDLKAKRRTQVNEGELAEDSKVTLHEYARDWIERYQGRGRRGFREDTRDDYRRQLEQYVFCFFPASLELRKLTPRMVGDFVAWLCDGRKQAEVHHRIKVERARAADKPVPKPLAPDATLELSDSTVRGILAPLRACLGTAVSPDGLIRFNPARDVGLPDRPRIVDDEDEDVRPLTTEQLATFLRVAPARWRTFFVLLAETGLRISEAIALEWRHVELDGDSPHVKVHQRIVRGKLGPPKSKYGRRKVPISHSLVVALRQGRAASEWPRETDPVFPSLAGTVLSPTNMHHRVLKPTAQEAGVPWAGFHTFRHTCASILFKRGRNAVQVQRWLGHHSPAFTLHTYVGLLDDDLGGALDVQTEVQTDPTPPDATTETGEESKAPDSLMFVASTPLADTPQNDF